MVKDFATLAMPSLTCSMMEGLDSEVAGAVEVVFVAGSPANLSGDVSHASESNRMTINVLIGHDYKETLCSILIRLQLVVGAVDSCTSCKEKQ